MEEEEGKNAPCCGRMDKVPMLWGYVDSYDVNNERAGGGAADAPPFAFFSLSPLLFAWGFPPPFFFPARRHWPRAGADTNITLIIFIAYGVPSVLLGIPGPLPLGGTECGGTVRGYGLILLYNE